MTSRLRQAAIDALATLSVPAQPDCALDRLTAELHFGTEHEILSLRLQPEGLRWKCSCGEPRCAHVTALLTMITGEPGPAATAARVESAPGWTRASLAPEPRIVEHTDLARDVDRAALSEALRDVVTAVVRAGVRTDGTASTEEALGRLVAAAPRPLPLGISRWVGRLREGLARSDVAMVARLLAGASQLALNLQAPEPDPDARRRIVTWLGATAHGRDDAERLTERMMLEVAREWLPGVERPGLERRYLLDLGDGTVYREERPRSGGAASLGPCPRIVHVAYAEIERSAAPRRIRLLQYTSSPQVPEAAWDQLRTWSTRDFALLGAGYREAVRAFSGLSEPFAMVLPAQVEHAPYPVLVDDARHQLPLVDGDDGTLRHLQEQPDTPVWLAGRLVERGGVIVLRPLSCAFAVDGLFAFERI